MPSRTTTAPLRASETAVRPPKATARRRELTSRLDRRWLALGAGLVLVSIPYLLSLGSPLRLAPDSVTYLSTASGIPLHIPHQVYPPGYPAMLSALGHLGLGTPWAFVGLNLAALAVGLAAAYVLCRRALGLTPMLAALVCLGTLLSHTLSLFSAVPVTEVPYFGVALTCVLVLWVADRRSGRERVALWGLALLMAAAAVSIRVLGLALVAPLLYVAVGGDRLARLGRALRRGDPAAVAALVGSFVVLIVGALIAIRLTSYSRHIEATWHTTGGVTGFLDNLALEMRTKIISLGELGSQTNCCVTAGAAMRPAYVALGLVVAGLVVYGWLERRRFGPVEAFVLGTAAVILVYAGGVARFWVAVIPFLLAYAILGALRLARLTRFRAPRYALALFAAAFAIAGGVWLAQSVRLSLANRQFPSLWARQVDAPVLSSYRLAWGEVRLSDLYYARPAAVAVLRRYEPLARVWAW
jgi:hypothetical protein